MKHSIDLVFARLVHSWRHDGRHFTLNPMKMVGPRSIDPVVNHLECEFCIFFFFFYFCFVFVSIHHVDFGDLGRRCSVMFPCDYGYYPIKFEEGKEKKRLVNVFGSKPISNSGDVTIGWRKTMTYWHSQVAKHVNTDRKLLPPPLFFLLYHFKVKIVECQVNSLA